MCLFAHRGVFGLQCEQRCERREAALGFVVGTLPDTRTLVLRLLLGCADVCSGTVRQQF